MILGVLQQFIMDWEVIKKQKKVTLTEEEDESTLDDEEAVRNGVEDCRFSCLGRIYLKIEFPIRVLRPLICKVWKLEKSQFMKIRSNVVQIFFKVQEIMDKILKDGPWCFHNKLVAL